jgi:hypothetical protein
LLDHLQTHCQILFDFTANYLEPLNGAFPRLAYLCSLREASSGQYLHSRLAAVYGAEQVHQVLLQCHEEVFERLLELPLTAQEEDLREYVISLPGLLEENLGRCRETAGNWAPPHAPIYLKELFCSNLNVLLELLRDNRPLGHSDS